MATAAAQEIQLGTGTERFYRPELDILRFIAFGMVFLAHSNGAHLWDDWGILGVPVFFLLSAFLITELLLREKDRTGTVHVRSFYVRRMLRIWPLYFAALGFGFLFVSPYFRIDHISLDDLLWYLFLVGNWRAATHGYLPAGMGPLWSIGVEEQFYLLWPLMIRKAGRKGILYTAVLMWVGSQVSVAVICLWPHPSFVSIWTNTFANLQFFALGAAFSVILRGRTPKLSLLARIALALGAYLLFRCSGMLLLLGHHDPLLGYVLPGLLVAGVAASLLFFSMLGVRLPRLSSPVVYLGKVSYGLYVMHLWVWLVVGALLVIMSRSHHANHIVQYMVSIPILIAIVMLSYNYFEKPFLRLKARFEIVKSRAA